MHVAQVSGFVDRQRRSPEQLLDAWPTIMLNASAVAAAGARVTVIQAAARNAVLQRDDVTLRFVAAASTRRSVAAVVRAVRAVRPDIIHFSGIWLPLHTWALRHALPNTPLLLQDRANPPGVGWRGVGGRALLRGVDGAVFTAAELATPFLAAGMLTRARIFEVPGFTSTFTPGDRDAARIEAGVYGDPCVVWVGRLNEAKDPFTAIAAFSRALDHLPDARLWCAYGHATIPVLSEVQRAIASDERLAASASLLGCLPNARIETLLRAADIFLLSSRREATGAALVEALACGATPVVTAIPAFRALTGNATVGALFPVGDAVAGAAALVAAARCASERGRVRCHFEEHWSPEALGRKLLRVYRDLLEG